MASQFYLVHHHIKPNMSDVWWAKVGGQTEEDSKQNEKSMMEKGFSTTLSCQWDQTGPCIVCGK